MKVGRWAPVLLVVFGIAVACSNDSVTNWTELVGGATSTAGSNAGHPNQVGGGGGGLGGSPVGGAISAGTGGAGGKTEPRGGAAGSPTAGAGGEVAAGGEGGSGGDAAGAAGAPTVPEGGAGGAAGAAGSGGEGGGQPLECEEESSVPTELPSCVAASEDAGDSCQSCLKASCCTEWQHCYGTSPQSKCGHGANPEEPGELECLHQCYLVGLATSIDSTELLQACASTCAGACLFLAPSTKDLVDCAIDECLDECLPAE